MDDFETPAHPLRPEAEDDLARVIREIERLTGLRTRWRGIVVVRGVDTIDASGVDDSILAHSYFVESIPVIRDIADMVRHRLPATQRGALKPVRGKDGGYWHIAPPK